MSSENLPGLMVPIIMAGGAGARLWPVSRDTMPKQFIGLLDDGLSTFQATLQRFADPRFAPPIVVTNNTFRFIAAEQMEALEIRGDIVLEPERRDSASAVAVGTVMASKRSADAICIVVAADHAIEATQAFADDCVLAAVIAMSGPIMTIGIEPTFASSAYGYLEPTETALGERAHTLARFVEKPDQETAERYVSEGFLWNSGNLIFSAASMLGEMEEHCPEVLNAASTAVDRAVRDLDFLRLDPDSFAMAPTISIDHALMEKTRKAGVIAASFDWSDIGAWDAIHALKQKDQNGNRLEGPVAVLDTRNSFIRSEEMLTTAVGLDDTIVVATHDAVLVASMKQAGRVKEMVAQLKRDGRREASEHLRIYRPWGWYQRIDLGDRFQVKHICVKPGGLLSLQRHHHRAEHWIVVHGTAEVTIDGTIKFYHENEAAYLPIGCVHRLHNPGKIDLKLIEVQVGSYTGEDDIVRIEDVYKRVSADK